MARASRGGTVSLYNQIVRYGLAPAMDLIRGTRTMRHLRELEESQWWPAERIEELQSRRLQALVKHAYVHVPYYRQIMQRAGLTPDDIRTSGDLSILPVLTRQAIRSAGDSLIADNVPRSALRPTSTSGSTGEPLHFYSTVEDQFSRGLARSFRALEWAGVNIGDRHATVSRPRHYARRREQLLNDASQRVRRSVAINYGSLSDESLSAVVAQLSRGRFTSLGGSPPLLALVADYARIHSASMPPVRAIVCGGEQLFPHERRLLRATWGPEPHSKYSSYEIYDIAAECDAHEGVHVQAEDVIVEITGERGLPVPAGQTGSLCLTNLHNYAMPFIRYAIGDIGSADPEPCRCGRSLPRLKDMIGRTTELIVTPSGRRIFAADIDLEAFSALGIRQFQILQEDIGSVTAFIVWHDDVDPTARVDQERELSHTLSRSMGSEISVTVRAVPWIMPTPAGKHMVVVSKIAPRHLDTIIEDENGADTAPRSIGTGGLDGQIQ